MHRQVMSVPSIVPSLLLCMWLVLLRLSAPCAYPRHAHWIACSFVKELQALRRKLDAGHDAAAEFSFVSLIQALRDCASVVKESSHDAVLTTVLSTSLWTCSPVSSQQQRSRDRNMSIYLSICLCSYSTAYFGSLLSSSSICRVEKQQSNAHLPGQTTQPYTFSTTTSCIQNVQHGHWHDIYAVVVPLHVLVCAPHN